jgi:MFS family permease
VDRQERTGGQIAELSGKRPSPASGPEQQGAGFSGRRGSLVAAIASVAVFGLSIGEAVPLLSLLLEQRGTNPAINGLNAGAAFIGVIGGPLLTPSLVRRFGIRTILLSCFAGDVVVFCAMKPFDDIMVWFVLRACLGFIGSTLFTTSEAWINLLAAQATRGRVIGIYAASLSVGFALGPLILAFTGLVGWAPFIANAVIVAIAALPLLPIANMVPERGPERPPAPLRMFRKAPVILAAVALFGLYETTLMALLPVWAERAGMSANAAAATLSLVYAGAIALQVPIGWLSDRVRRMTILRLCGVVGLGGAVVLSVTGASSLPVLSVILFLWGGIVAGIYPVALGMAGDRFSGNEMVAANAAIIMAYGLGALIGPALGGAGMDLSNALGLPGLFVLLFAVFTAITLKIREPA